MHIKLIEQLICPVCKKELQWNILQRNNVHIIEGFAKCFRCETTYPVKDGIAVFLPGKWQNVKIWERSERIVSSKRGVFAENQSATEEKLNSHSANEILVKICLRNEQGEVSNEELYDEYMKTKGMPDTLYKLSLLAQKCANEVDDSDYVLDFASGKCILAGMLADLKKCCIIISDINPIIVLQSKLELEKYNCHENLSFMAFDIKKCPFKDKSIHTITTLLGLQNIVPYIGVMEEINRIADIFFNISAYLTEKLPSNIQVLDKFHMTDVWVKDKFKIITDQLGWQGKQIYTTMDLAKGISREEIETRFAVMKFPVEDEILEYNLTEYLIGNKNQKT